MQMKTLLISSAIVSASALLISGCAGSTTNASSPTSPAVTASPTSHEVAEAQPRVVVTYQDHVEVLSLDGSSLVSVASFDTTAAVRPVVGPDGRHVYLVDGEGGSTTVLDSGSYAQGHGDHFHYYTREPAMRPDVITGNKPVHVVGHDGVVAVFNDGDGTVNLFDEIGLTAGGLTVETVPTNAAHHGVAVPVPDGLVVTSLGDDEGPLPDSVTQVSTVDGSTIASYADVCPSLHGEAVADNKVLFGCAMGVLVIDPTAATSDVVPYPADAGELRIGSFIPGGDVVIGNWGTDGFSVVDLAARTVSPVVVGTAIAGMARGEDDTVITLTADGAVSGFTTDGTAIGAVTVMDPFELTNDHTSTRPGLTMIGHVAVITDPAAHRLLLVDTEDWTVLDEHPLTGKPTAVVSTGLSRETTHQH